MEKKSWATARRLGNCRRAGTIQGRLSLVGRQEDFSNGGFMEPEI
jgi:hypothetical protein